MLREEYLRRLIDRAHVELYLSAVEGARLYWPWRMHPPCEARDRFRNACEWYVVDSDPMDESVTTSDVLDTAATLDAEVASLQDVYLDKDATVDSLLAGLAIADDHDFDGDLLLPLQEPVVDCWRELGEPTNHWLGIGGLKDATEAERIDACHRLRDAVGQDVHIHGFGWGPRNRLAQEIRATPTLLDSLDYSTPVTSNVDASDLAGDERMSVVAMNAAQQLVRDLRRVSDCVTNETEQESVTGW